MKEYMGSHYSEVDFPIIPGKKAKYKTYTYQDLEINFGDVVYILPEMVMHYLDDAESIGWSWIPPKDFIDRVMKGGDIKFTTTLAEKLRVQDEAIGFLRKGEGEFKDKIVDTKGGDANYQNAKPVELGRASEIFLQRMQQLVELARHEAPAINLESVPGYENILIPIVPPKKVSYRGYIGELMHTDLEQKGVKPSLEYLPCWYYMIAQDLPFYSLGKDEVITNVELIADYDFRLGFKFHQMSRAELYQNLKQEIPKIFAHFNIEFDKDCEFPCLKVSGKNLEKLKSLNIEPIELNDTASFQDKIYAVLGYRAEKYHLEKHKIELDLHGFSGTGDALEDFVTRNHLLKDGISYRKDTTNYEKFFEQTSHLDQFAFGHEFCAAIEKEYKNNFAYKLKKDKNVDKKSPSTLVTSLSSVVGSTEKKSEIEKTELKSLSMN